MHHAEERRGSASCSTGRLQEGKLSSAGGAAPQGDEWRNEEPWCTMQRDVEDLHLAQQAGCRKKSCLVQGERHLKGMNGEMKSPGAPCRGM